MSSLSINSISMTVKIHVTDNQTCNLLYEALVLESGHNPNDRAQANLTVDNNFLILEINAKDPVSARASINSFMKWINLSLQIISMTENTEK
ncbi:MAG: KEOPS complex subunit Pcc1 [Candidatus Heimdallarchaeaceae archaeon]